MTATPVRESPYIAASFLAAHPITLTGTPAAGATLVYYHESNANASTITSITGIAESWTKVARVVNGSSNCVVEKWVGKNCNGTDNSITVNFSATAAMVANIVEWTGLAGTFGTPATGSGSSGTAVSSGTVIPAVGDVVLSVMGDPNSGTITPSDTPAAFTAYTTRTATQYRAAGAYRIATTTDPHARTWTKGTSSRWSAITTVLPQAAVDINVSVPTATATAGSLTPLVGTVAEVPKQSVAATALTPTVTLGDINVDVPTVSVSAAPITPTVYTATAKISDGHPLASHSPIRRLTSGALGGMTNVQNCTVVDSRFASSVAGTDAFAREVLPSAPGTLRITAIIKADKTAGRHSWVGISTVAAATITSRTAEIGHTAGSGIQIRSQGSGFGSAFTILAESELVDGAEYRVCLAYTGAAFANPGGSDNGRWCGWVENANGSTPAFSPSNATPVDRRWDPATNVPASLVARTNSPNGTIRDLHYVDNMFAASDDLGVFRAFPYYGSAGERMGIWTKGLAAPLRLVVFTGGTSSYGGWQNSMGYPLAGSPRDDYRRVWEVLADAGYTVITPNALHEGWGADVHMASILEAVADVAAAAGTADHRYFHIGYSGGGISVWRATMRRAGCPPVVAGYMMGGGADLAQFTPFAGMTAKWGTDPAGWDNPATWSGADLIAKGTRIRSVIGTADTNVPKVEHHDVMKAKYGGDPLFSEIVLSGVNHFQSAYWDPVDVASFFDAADTDWVSPNLYRVSPNNIWTPVPQALHDGSAWVTLPNDALV